MRTSNTANEEEELKSSLIMKTLHIDYEDFAYSQINPVDVEFKGLDEARRHEKSCTRLTS